MKLGIVGLPNVGKSTLFNSLTKAGAAEAANYPFCTIEPNVGVVPVPDKRLDVLTQMHNSAKTIHAVIDLISHFFPKYQAHFFLPQYLFFRFPHTDSFFP